MTHDEFIKLATDVFEETSTTRHPPGMHPRRWEWLKELAQGVLDLSREVEELKDFRNTRDLVAELSKASVHSGFELQRVFEDVCVFKKIIKERDAAVTRAEMSEAENRDLQKQLAELQYQQEADTNTIGILADVVDVLWEDDTRSEKHGCGDVVAKAKEVVALANK